MTQKSMKAVRIQDYGGPEVLEIVEVPIPHPGEGQVQIRVKVRGGQSGRLEDAGRSL